MLLEFIGSEDDHAETGVPPKTQVAAAPKTDDMEIVNQVMRGIMPPNNSASSARRA
jgi:hypothetical protein